MTPDEIAAPYVKLVKQAAGWVREDDPAAVHRRVRAAIEDIRRAEYEAGVPYVDLEQAWLAAFIVAVSAFPTDQPWSELVSWRLAELPRSWVDAA